MLGWYVDVSTWEPASPQWKRALEALPDDDQQKIQRFVFVEDQRLALASRLLQRQLIHSEFQIPWHDICIARTAEGKPYWQRPSTTTGASVPPCWNYNVSHHGTIVAVAAHATALVGVDVVRLSERPKRRANTGSASVSDEFFRAFTDHFTANEWRYIRRSDDEAARFHAFYRLWSLKEAYIKAVGIGLGFQLLRAEFSPRNDQETDWQMRLDGQLPTAKWRFRSLSAVSHDQSDPHLISVALGPPSEMWNSHIDSLGLPPHAFDPLYETTEIPRDFSWQQKSLEELLP